MQRCLDRPTRAVCIREVQRSLDHSVKLLIWDKVQAFGAEREFRNLTNRIEAPGHGTILFQGMQNHTAESMKSLEGFDVAWVEEAQALSDNSLTLLRPTIRARGSELWFSWNPRSSADPVDAMFRGGEPPPDTACVKAGWEDNPYLPDVMLREIEWMRRRDPEKFAHVYGGGYLLHSEARVFKHFKVEDAGPPPANAIHVLGGDWGFATDPTVLLDMWIDPAQPRRLVIDHEAYEVGCEIEDTPALWDGLWCDGGCPEDRTKCMRPTHGAPRKYVITADNARPETISHMQRHGYPKIVASVKGPNSVAEGVEFLQSYDIVINPRCKHAVDEFTHYSYKVDRTTGQVQPELQDDKNHVIDSARYALESTRRQGKVKARSLF